MMRLDLMAFCGLTWKRGVEKGGVRGSAHLHFSVVMRLY
jgi:hypothetical protein